MRISISIVVPTLNEETALPRLLEDLSNQTNKNFEVIVVDAKSTDLTRVIALSFKTKLPLRFITSQKRNVAYQRNVGANRATTDYLFFIDADTRIAYNAIEKLLCHIKKEKKQLYLPLITPSNPTIINHILVTFSVQSVKFLQRVKTPLSTGPIIVIRKPLFNQIKGFDESITIGEDHDVVIKAYHAGVSATFLKDVICQFSMRRFDSAGTWQVVWQYSRIIREILMNGTVVSKNYHYEMGGQRYLK